MRILYAVAHPCRKNHQCQIVHLQVAPGCACITIIFQPCFATVGGGGVSGRWPGSCLSSWSKIYLTDFEHKGRLSILLNGMSTCCESF